MKVHIGADHAGFELKQKLMDAFSNGSIEWVDHGTYSENSVDYPDFAHPTALAVEKENGRGILICGSANGVCITANKHQGVRAALCWTPEITKLARQHNDANIMCLPARFISGDSAVEMVRLFIDTPFEGGRHANRVSKISC
jgi:ribose 5-phosphate isomerase B